MTSKSNVRVSTVSSAAMWALVVISVCAAQLRLADANVVTTPLTPTGSIQQPTVIEPAVKTVLLPQQDEVQVVQVPEQTHHVHRHHHQQVVQPAATATARQVATVSEAGNWRLMGRLLLECSRTGDLIGCLKLKAVTSLGRALASSAPIPLMEDISLAKDPEVNIEVPSDAPKSETELEASLPRSMEERSNSLDKMLFERLDAFLRSRTVQFNMPLGLGLFEGRGKKDKKGGYAMVMVAAMAGMYMQMTMGGMAMMSGKALIVAKIALVLAAICLLKKSGGGGGGDGHSQVVYTTEQGGGGWHRSFPAPGSSPAPVLGTAAPHLGYHGADYPGGYARYTAPEYTAEGAFSGPGDGVGTGGGESHHLVYGEQRRSTGRGKGGLGGKKGYGGYLLLMVAGLKAMMMQSAMGGIAMMSGKALLVAKIALLLALLCCLKKGGGEESKAHVVYAAPAPEHGGGGGGGWQSGGGGDWNRRSASDPNYAQNYAYNAHHRYNN